MKNLIAGIGILSLVIGLSACGTTTGDRAVSGGGIGAATGAVAGAVLGGPVLGATLLGGAVGAATGAATSPGSVNLGKPVWDK
jgi:osmotically inducible lipoprotein OsmB